MPSRRIWVLPIALLQGPLHCSWQSRGQSVSVLFIIYVNWRGAGRDEQKWLRNKPEKRSQAWDVSLALGYTHKQSMLCTFSTLSGHNKGTRKRDHAATSSSSYLMILSHNFHSVASCPHTRRLFYAWSLVRFICHFCVTHYHVDPDL